LAKYKSGVETIESPGLISYVK